MLTRFAILGSSGYVGKEFTKELMALGHDVAIVSRSNVDIYNKGDLITTLRSIAPQYLINCAGYTGKPNVDACENDKDNCLLANTVLPGVIKAACEELKIRWGHISSGCIYTGSHSDGSGFTERDVPNFSFRTNNCSWYSGTKALGEEVLKDSSDLYLWRLRIPFSPIDSPRNYLTKLQRYSTLLEARNSLSFLPEFVRACIDSCIKGIPTGTYNLTNPGSITTSEVVRLIQDSGICKKSYSFFESEEQFMSTTAKTPRSNCVLDSSKAINAGLNLTPVHDAIEIAIQNWKKQAN